MGIHEVELIETALESLLPGMEAERAELEAKLAAAKAELGGLGRSAFGHEEE